MMNELPKLATDPADFGNFAFHHSFIRQWVESAFQCSV